MAKSFTKDPDAVLDYQMLWSDWLGTDTIINSSWIADDDGITVDSSTFTNTGATVWLSGGVLGARYRVTNRIVTAGGRTDDRSFRIGIIEK